MDYEFQMDKNQPEVNMKTAIIYASTHGTTAKVAAMLSEKFGENNTRLFDLRNKERPDLAEFDRVILGGSIHAGMIQRKVKKYCEKHMVELLGKPLGLFICGMNEPEFDKELKEAFPELLLSHAKSKKAVGGEFLFGKMNFFQKAIVKKISGIHENVSRIREDAVYEMVLEMNENTSGN